ncbi:MAG: Omp28-related outer membrane protein, partial [Paludibacteraceae bacterium]
KKQTSSLVFHPAYLSELQTELEETTYASVSIRSSFDASTRNLSMIVKGLVADTTVNELQLTVLIKENNLIGTQADYYDSWEGWSEFRHNKVVRTFLTAPLGDKVAVVNQQYADTLAIALDNEWNADNCVIVAYITPADNQPVINAEQVPVVANTTGGEEYEFEGITMVEVPESYPEEGAPMSPMSVTAYAYVLQTGVYGLEVYGSQTVTVSGYACTPLALMYVISQNLAEGVYPINGTMGNNTVWAGYRDDENFSLEGSALYYAENSYLQQGYIYPFAIWLIANGNMTIGTNNAFSLDATTLNGSPLKMEGTYEIVSLNAPAKKNTFAPLRLSEQTTPADMPARKYSLFSNL